MKSFPCHVRQKIWESLSPITWPLPHTQANSVVKSIYGGFRCLWSSTSYTSEELRVKLVKALIMPHFTNCSSVLERLSGILFAKLQRLVFSQFLVSLLYSVGVLSSLNEYYKYLIYASWFTLDCFWFSKFFKITETIFQNTKFVNFARNGRILKLANDWFPEKKA